MGVTNSSLYVGTLLDIDVILVAFMKNLINVLWLIILVTAPVLTSMVIGFRTVNNMACRGGFELSVN